MARERSRVHVLVCTREDDYHDRYRQPDKLEDGQEIDWPVPFWFVDAGAALMLLLLAAIDEGLAAGSPACPGSRRKGSASPSGFPVTSLSSRSSRSATERRIRRGAP